jgi:hypothetical protein
MANPVADGRLSSSPTARGQRKGVKDMHPYIMGELARVRIEEQLQYAERERLAQAARKDRPRSIDFSGLAERLRVRLFGGSALGSRPTAGAAA